MKFLLALELALIIIQAAPASDLVSKWQAFKVKFGRSYDKAEEAKRFKIFSENFKKIKEHNEKYRNKLVTFTVGINQFTDMTQEEVREKMTGHKKKSP